MDITCDWSAGETQGFNKDSLHYVCVSMLFLLFLILLSILNIPEYQDIH